VFRVWKLLKFIYLFVVKFEVKKFENSFNDPQGTQAQTYKNILGSISFSEFRNLYSICGENQIPLATQRLKNEKILNYEMTSGSSGRPKKIPYSKSLMGSFHSMFRLWAYDVLKNVPLSNGCFFFSISPQQKLQGFEEDSDYLQLALRWLMKPFWTIDVKSLRGLKSENLMRELSLQLSMKNDLEIISVWSPSYLLSIMSEIEMNKVIQWEKVWPELKFISVWGSAMASTDYEKIKKLFPQAYVQKKGLLATECPVTIPWTSSGGFVPLLQEVFFEFRKDNQLFLIHELSFNEIYEIIVTTKGGLYRYELGDLVQVTGFYKNTPLLEFVGRTHDICDLVGEKLSERAIREYVNESQFFIAVPDQKNSQYVFFMETELSASEVDQRLQSIFHYKVARDQRQLKEVRTIQRSKIKQEYFLWLESKKMRLGDIKEKCLISNLEMACDFLQYLKTEHQLPQPSVQSDRF
jgi:hypothetical protein